MSKMKLLAGGFNLLIALAIVGCGANNEQLLQSSSELLELDRQWTDITTYQEEFSGLVDLPISNITGKAFTRSDNFRIRNYTAKNASKLSQIRFDQNLTTVSDKLSGVKLSLANIYDQEEEMFIFGEWKPYLNHVNGEEVKQEFRDIPEFGRSSYDHWVYDNFLGSWLDIQLQRKKLYAHWRLILEDAGVDSATLGGFDTVINKN